jgi:hypothetical protein
MPNLNLPKGFEPKGASLRVNVYTAGATVYPGDMCLAPDGTTGQVSPSAGAAAEVLLGACIKGGTVGQQIEVSDHPSQLYIVQAAAGEVDNVNDIGKFAEVKATAGSATFDVSRQEIDTVANTNTKPLRIREIVAMPKNEVGSEPIRVVVSLNTPAL